MRKFTKRTLIVAILLAMMLSVLAPLGALAHTGTSTITVFHTNDMHGTYESGAKTIGFDKIATLKKTTPNSILLDAGDFSQGTPIASVTKGQAMLDMMIAAGYDGIAVGNHEFDYTAADLKAMNDKLTNANIPFLTNLGGTGDFDFLSTDFSRYFTTDIDGVKVGIFAITTPTTLVTGSPTKLANVDFKENTPADPTAFDRYVTDTVQTLKVTNGCDVVIALTHCGYDAADAEYTSGYIAGLGAGSIDLIIDGHDHASRMGASTITHASGTKIVSSGSSLSNLGKVELTVTDGVVTAVNSTAISGKTDGASISADPTAAAAVKTVVDTLEPLFTTVIGTTDHTLWGGNVNNGYPDASSSSFSVQSLARRVETNLGSLVADARLWQAKQYIAANWNAQYGSLPIVCFQVGGGVRATIKPGNITMKDVLTVMPFGSREYYVTITPQELYGAIENGMSALTTQDPDTGAVSGDGNIHGRFSQVAGMTFKFDIAKTAGVDRVQEVRLADGTLLDKNDTTTQMVLVTTEYEVGGGDGYAVLRGKTQFDDNKPNSDAFVDYVKTVLGGKVTVNADYDGRITMINSAVGGYSATSFDASLYLKEKDTAITSGSFKVYDNGTLLGSYTPDAQGKITVSLAYGKSHCITVESPSGFVSSEGLLDNRAGLSDHYWDEAFSTVVTPPQQPGQPGQPNVPTGDPIVAFSLLGLISCGAFVTVKSKLKK